MTRGGWEGTCAVCQLRHNGTQNRMCDTQINSPWGMSAVLGRLCSSHLSGCQNNRERDMVDCLQHSTFSHAAVLVLLLFLTW